LPARPPLRWRPEPNRLSGEMLWGMTLQRRWQLATEAATKAQRYIRL